MSSSDCCDGCSIYRKKYVSNYLDDFNNINCQCSIDFYKSLTKIEQKEFKKVLKCRDLVTIINMFSEEIKKMTNKVTKITSLNIILDIIIESPPYHCDTIPNFYNMLSEHNKQEFKKFIKCPNLLSILQLEDLIMTAISELLNAGWTNDALRNFYTYTYSKIKLKQWYTHPKYNNIFNQIPSTIHFTFDKNIIIDNIIDLYRIDHAYYTTIIDCGCDNLINGIHIMIK